MKKLLIALLLLIGTLTNAQNTITWYRITGDTLLNSNPFSTSNSIRTGYYNINPKTGVQSRWANGVWVTDSLFKGQKGDPGSAGSSIINGSVFWSPEQYGAINQLQTFSQRGISQDTINSRYPGMGFTVNDFVDWAAWQMAIKQASANGGAVYAKGGIYYIGAKSIMIDKYASRLEVNGGNCRIISTGTSPIFSRTSPNDNTDANQMVNLKCTFRNMTLKGTNAQIGIDIGPSYGAYYQSINGETLAECIHLRFALRTTVDNCFSTNCNVGWVADRGNWAGSSNSNSQSNHTTFRSCRWFGAGDAGFKIIAASGCVIEDCIIEGASVRAGIDFDGQGSTVVKDFTVRNTHFECSSGSTEACIKIRMHSGLVTIDKVYGQYASILVDAGATIGYMNVRISNISYWVFKAGKAFNNAGNVGWVFEGNDNPFQTNTPSTTVPTWFNGVAPSLCNGVGCGSNRFFYTGIPR